MADSAMADIVMSVSAPRIHNAIRITSGGPFHRTDIKVLSIHAKEIGVNSANDRNGIKVW